MNINNGSCLFNIFLALILINWMLTIWATEFLLQHEDGRTTFPKEGLKESLRESDDKIHITNDIQPIKLPRRVQSYPRKSDSNISIHDPTQLRNCLALTATPAEFKKLRGVVNRILLHAPYRIFDCIHLTLPDHFLRLEQQQQQNSSSQYAFDMDELRSVFTNERIILHKVAEDYGPMTRYLGPLSYEKHPDTRIVIFDLYTIGITTHLDLTRLIYASSTLDGNAMWCHQGENFVMNQYNQTKSVWDTFPLERAGEKNASTFNLVHFCRGVGGLLFLPKHFDNFWWNQTDYHESCFWDDDRWVSFQMERQGIAMKVIHETENYNISRLFSRRQPQPQPQLQQQQPLNSHHRRLGSLTLVTNKLKSAQTCPIAWLNQHPETYPTARVTSNCRWPGLF